MLLPDFLEREIAAQYSSAQREEIMQGYGAHRPVSFRVNPLRGDRSEILQSLADAGIGLVSVPWYQDAFTTNASEEELQKTPVYERGEIYLQSLSSMLPPLALEAKAGESVLDMTAAPGGKTTQIAALTNGGALITACERDGGRFSRLEYNVKKQGAPRVTLMHCDATRLDEYFRFDSILLDAPCSGSGTLREGYPVRINEKTLVGCIKTQSALIKKAWRLLKKGGTLVYSTCSILRRENEEILAQLPKSEVQLLPLQLPTEIPALSRSEGILCVKPDETFEGFFLAKIGKR